MTGGVAPPPPRRLQLEVTAACNLRCEMCLVAYRPAANRRTARVPLERLTTLLDELPAVEEVVLQGLGEPLLVPELPAMVAAVRERGARVGFNTNATLLTRARADALVAAGLSWLHVSLDGATASTYEAIRVGARFDRVVRNIEHAVAARAAAGADDPELSIVMVLMRRNLDELPALVALAGRLGVPAVSVQSLSHDFADVGADPAYAAIARYADREEVTIDDPHVRAVCEEARTTAAARGVTLRLPGPGLGVMDVRPRPACSAPWDAGYVTASGRLQPCCMVMGTDRADLGDVDDRGFLAAWHGDAAREFRARLLDDDDPPEVCRGCAAYGRTF